jgi:hypothetical protein
MRKFVSDVIAPEDLGALLDLELNQKRHDFDVAKQIPSFANLMKLIEEQVPKKVIWDAPSYYRIESRSKAHSLHFDGCRLDGTPNHMSWCDYTAVSVLTTDWNGGTLRLHNPVMELGKELYRSVIVFSSGSDNDPQAHERDKHDGKRVALLLFLATEK